MKRVSALLVGGLVVLGLFAGCTAGAPAPPSASASAAASSAPATARLTADAVAEGVYDIDVDTDSSMVKVVAASLAVRDGAMTASLSLVGEGFSRLYAGTSAEAASAPASDICDYYVNDQGKYTFDFPVEALDEDVEVALFGQRRDTWYDHVFVFESGRIPADAILR